MSLTGDHTCCHGHRWCSTQSCKQQLDLDWSDTRLSPVQLPFTARSPAGDSNCCMHRKHIVSKQKQKQMQELTMSYVTTSLLLPVCEQAESNRRRVVWKACLAARLLESRPGQLQLLSVPAQATAVSTQQTCQLVVWCLTNFCLTKPRTPPLTVTTAPDPSGAAGPEPSDGPLAKKSRSASFSQLSSPATAPHSSSWHTALDVL